MSDYMKIEWADIREGDVLMHENGDRMTVAWAVFEDGRTRLHVGGAWRASRGLAESGFTPYRRKPELPTKPGAYHDKDGDYWLLDRAGKWYDWSRLDEPNVWEGRTENYAPYTRLVPMPSSDAVLEVVKKAEPMCMRERITDAVMALLRGDGQ